MRRLLCFFGTHHFGAWITDGPYRQIKFCGDKRCNLGRSRWYSC